MSRVRITVFRKPEGRCICLSHLLQVACNMQQTSTVFSPYNDTLYNDILDITTKKVGTVVLHCKLPPCTDNDTRYNDSRVQTMRSGIVVISCAK